VKPGLTTLIKFGAYCAGPGTVVRAALAEGEWSYSRNILLIVGDYGRYLAKF
jgi:hypothetical protein